MEIIDDFKQEKYNFLMNSYKCYVLYDGADYPSAEHAYQAAKTTDTAIRAEIANTPTAREARRLGQSSVSLRDGWDDMRVSVMRAVLESKFHLWG